MTIVTEVYTGLFQREGAPFLGRDVLALPSPVFELRGTKLRELQPLWRSSLGCTLRLDGRQEGRRMAAGHERSGSYPFSFGRVTTALWDKYEGHQQVSEVEVQDRPGCTRVSSRLLLHTKTP